MKGFRLSRSCEVRSMFYGFPSSILFLQFYFQVLHSIFCSRFFEIFHLQNQDMFVLAPIFMQFTVCMFIAPITQTATKRVWPRAWHTLKAMMPLPFPPLFSSRCSRVARNYSGLSGGPCAASCRLVGRLHDAVAPLVDPDVRAPVYS